MPLTAETVVGIIAVVVALPPVIYTVIKVHVRRRRAAQRTLPLFEDPRVVQGDPGRRK